VWEAGTVASYEDGRLGSYGPEYKICVFSRRIWDGGLCRRREMFRLRLVVGALTWESDCRGVRSQRDVVRRRGEGS